LRARYVLYAVLLCLAAATARAAARPVPAARAIRAPRAIPPLALTVTPATRLLVVSPHPDDEALGAAGLIQRVVAGGGQVRVVLMTSGDAFSEGVETEDGIAKPTADDYRNYGTLRERETASAMALLGVDAAHVTFLGFPDDGLCQLAAKYLSVKAAAFASPYTRRDSPPATEQIIRGVSYRGYDLRRELERILVGFAPTLIALPHPEDEHPDHCSTHIFAKEAIETVWPGATPRPRIIHYIVHYGQWPLDPAAGGGSQLRPPAKFPREEGRWASLRLTPAESAAKKQALFAYASQMLVIGRFMLAFGRDNELFLEGEPARLPECWCSGENVATELPVAKRRRKGRPPR
jgi:LmbE family N-acetylglucosaminyl deacetylase